MAKLPTEARTEKVIRVFERVGFTRQGRSSDTSHERLKRSGPHGTVTVKHPTMRVGLLRSCIRDANMTTEEFLRLYSQV